MFAGARCHQVGCILALLVVSSTRIIFSANSGAFGKKRNVCPVAFCFKEEFSAFARAGSV